MGVGSSRIHPRDPRLRAILGLSTILYKPIADILPGRSYAAAAARLLQTITRNLLSSAIPWPSAPDTTTPIASKSKARTCVLGRR